MQCDSRRELERCLTYMLSSVEVWSAKNKLDISYQKTVAVMLKGRLDSSKPPHVKIAGGVLRWSDHA